MIVPINWLNYYVAIYQYMKMTYRCHDMEDYIDYHDMTAILYIINVHATLQIIRMSDCFSLIL